jgi:dienelactone hydrolase
MGISRREFHTWLAAGGLGRPATESRGADASAAASDIDNLYPFAQKQADRSQFELSFLRPEFKSLKHWQEKTRRLVFEHLYYDPPPIQPDPQLIRRTEHDDFFEEYLTFQTTPDLRVPAFVLVPKRAKFPAPGIVALHDHGGFYVWGKEKLLEQPGEHAELTTFRRLYYGGRSVAAELARLGYVVVVIDMFYWGERRMLLEGDPEAYRSRSLELTKKEIDAFNRRSGNTGELVARTLFVAGVSWPGVMLWDDIRTVDYLVSRPEVDRQRLGCVGLSVGGYRSFFLAALDPRIKAAVDVGWMTTYGSLVKHHLISTIDFSFHIPGLYRYVDLPDLSGLIAPRAVMIVNCSRDTLFPQEGQAEASDKIRRCYEKAGAPERQTCIMSEGPHEFNTTMQDEAWKWFARWI